jgi:hypothetical protein
MTDSDDTNGHSNGHSNGHKSGIWAYQQRILALENDLIKAKQSMKRLLHRLSHDPGGVDLKVAKTQLDLLDGLVRLTKVQTAYYVKLGQIYDLVAFHDLFVKELERRDPFLAMQIIEELLDT